MNTLMTSYILLNIHKEEESKNILVSLVQGPKRKARLNGSEKKWVSKLTFHIYLCPLVWILEEV